MLDVREVPNCCTMKILTGFGGSAHGGLHSRDREYTRPDLVAELIEKCDELRERGMAIVMATTSSDQEIAIASLREAGFAHSKWASKTTHRETQIRVWYKRLNPEGVP
jgi:hypothetical protein